MSYSTQTGSFQIENLGTDLSVFDVSGLSGGGTAVLLSGYVGSQSFFYLEMYDGAGSLIGSQVDLNALASNEALVSQFRVMGLSNGNVLVTYAKRTASAGSNDAYFFVVDQSGQKVVNDVKINTSGGSEFARGVDAIELDNGNVAFSFQRADNNSVATRVFTTAGASVSSETLISNTIGLKTAIAASTDGSYIVTYGAGSNNGVNYKTYSASGAELTSGSLVSGVNGVDWETVGLSNGDYAFTYSSIGAANSTVKILNASGIASNTLAVNGSAANIVPVASSDGTTGFVSYSVVNSPAFVYGAGNGSGQTQVTLHYYSNSGTLVSSTPNVASGNYYYSDFNGSYYEQEIAASFKLYGGHDQGSGLLITHSPNVISTNGTDERYTIGAVVFDQAAGPVVTLSTDTTSIAEAAGVATITATLSAVASTNTVVTLSLAGTATGSGTDYTAAATTITILAGQLAGTTTLTAVQDTLDENNETIIVGIQSVTGGDDARADTGQVTVSIIDDDPLPSVSIADSNVTEGDSGSKAMVFTVTLGTASGKAVTVNYVTSDGTANAGSDYTATSGTVSFAAGETSKQINVAILGDTTAEPNETFTVTLSGPINATLGTSSATGTIIDDENPAPVVDTPSAITLTDTSAADTFGTVTGTLSASDADGIEAYGITGSSAANQVIGGVTYDLSRAGTYGTLYVKASSGEYAYVPNAAVINALNAGPQSETFTVSATDKHGSPATGTSSLVINVTGANDLPTGLSLGNASVNQSGGIDAVVGSFITDDVDTGQAHTYALVTGDGSNDVDNPSFSILGGSLRANDATALAAGNYKIVVRTTDSAGGTFDQALTVTVVDDVRPTVSIGAISFDQDTGANPGDFVTRVAAQKVSATLSAALGAGELVLVSLDSGSSWTDVTDSVSGTQLTWNGATLLSGSHTLQLKVVDTAGNEGPLASQSYELDTLRPATPVISSAALTKNTAPVITGVAENGASIIVTVAGATYVTVSSAGSWSVDLGTTPDSGTLALNMNGNNAVSVTATDTAGNTSTAATQTLVIDTTPPGQPVVTSAALGNDITPVIAGTAEAGATVTVVVAGATYTTVANAGTWAIDLGTATPSSGSLSVNPNGSNAISVTATDLAGNTSNPGVQTLVIDSTVPGSPIINSLAPSKNTTPVISGTAEADATVTVVIGGATYTTTATGGNWSVDLATATPVGGVLALDTNGDNLISATATDAAGNTSGAGTKTVFIDNTPPAVPVITSAPLANPNSMVISGTAESGTIVLLSIGGATYDISVVGGTWSIDLATAVPANGSPALNPDGDNTISVTAQDSFNNVSGAATGTLTIDSTIPDAPVITSAALTKTAAPVIGGTAEADAVVTVTVAGATYITVATGGNWSIDLDTDVPNNGVLTLDPNGSNALSVTASDLAGNVSNAGTQTLVIDTTAPLTVFSAVTLSADKGTSHTDFVTNTAAQTIEASLSVLPLPGDKVFGSVNGGTTWIDITASVLGTQLKWVNISLLAGTHDLQFKVTDEAGNDSNVYSQAYTLDTQVPLATSAANLFSLSADTGASTSDLITQTAQQDFGGVLNAALAIDEFVEVSVDGGVSWVSAQANPGDTEWLASNLTLLAGSHNLSVRVSDKAGNHGTAISRAYVLDNSAPQFDTARVNGASLVLSFTDTVALDALNLPPTSAFVVAVASNPVVVNAVTIDAVAKTVTLTLATAVSAGQAVTVGYTDPGVGDDPNAIQDAAGNDVASFLPVPVTNNTPAVPTTPTVPTVPTAPVDGVPVQVGTGTDGLPQVTVPVVTNGRNEDTSTPNSKLADIPVVRDSAGVALLTVGVPVGTGLTASGSATPISGAAAQTQLDSRIPADSTLKAAGQSFLNGLAAGTQVVIQGIKLDAQAANGGPLVISANNTGDGHRTALVIDTSALAGTSLIDLENVDFAVVMGDARVTGGAGANTVFGDDGRQFIVLGEDDDVLHGGGNDDTVGSLRGKDQAFGDDGDDIVYGGTGDDIVHGGNGNDQMNGGFGFDTGVQSGVLADYTVTRDGHTVVLTHKVSGEVDRFLDVEHITFDSGTSIIVAHEAADVAALTAQFAGAQLIELNANRAVTGSDIDDEVTPELGIALNIDLGAGQDIVRLAGARTDVHIDVEAGQRAELTRLEDGAMLAFNNVEMLAFANGDVTVLAHNHEEAVIGRAYELLLGRNVDTSGYSFWIAGIENGASLHATLAAMMASPEYTGAASSNSAFLDLLYTTGLDRTADASGKAFWLAALDGGVSRAQVLEGFAASTEAAIVIGSTIDVTVVS